MEPARKMGGPVRACPAARWILEPLVLHNKGRIQSLPAEKREVGRELFLRKDIAWRLGILSVIGAHVAQSAEHILGKDEVSGSIPLMGSIKNITEVLYG